MTATDTTMDATAAAGRAEGLSREILVLAGVVILGTIMTVLDGADRGGGGAGAATAATAAGGRGQRERRIRRRSGRRAGSGHVSL